MANKAQRSAPGSAEAEQFFMDANFDYERKEDLLKVRWPEYSPSDDTWEPPGNISFNSMALYFRRHKQRIPRHLHHFQATKLIRQPGSSLWMVREDAMPTNIKLSLRCLGQLHFKKSTKHRTCGNNSLPENADNYPIIPTNG